MWDLNKFPHTHHSEGSLNCQKAPGHGWSGWFHAIQPSLWPQFQREMCKQMPHSIFNVLLHLSLQQGLLPHYGLTAKAA
jgi:hypothetical protein